MAVVSASSSLPLSCAVLSCFSANRSDPGGGGAVLWASSSRSSSSSSSSSHVGLRRLPRAAVALRPAPVAFRNGVYTYRGQRWRVSCGEATWSGKDFENRAGQMAEEARRKASDAAKAVSGKVEELLNNAKRKAGQFSDQNDLGGKVNRAAQTANRKFEEIGYETKRTAAKWDREYRISEKVQEAREFAAEQIQNADRQLGVRQRARNFSTDFRLKWPKYRKQFGNFLETPVGKSFVTLFMVWLVFSGWLFRILLVSIWVLPFAAPLLLSTLSKAAIVEGVCPNCGQRYVGGRTQAVTCSRCKGVVWQPRQDFSKDKSDPRIIDIDIEPQ